MQPGASSRRYRRASAAALSICVNGALVILACLPRPSSYEETAAAEAWIVASFVPAAHPRRPPTPQVRISDHSLTKRRTFAVAPTASRGPPTETFEALRAAMQAAHAQGNEPDGRRCDDVTLLTLHEHTADALLALHVGVDGRVLEVELERSTGNVRADAALRVCAASWGPFPLAIVDGRIMESWQRITWAPASVVSQL